MAESVGGWDTNAFMVLMLYVLFVLLVGGMYLILGGGATHTDFPVTSLYQYVLLVPFCVILNTF
jgi:hypothetical protein